MSGRFRTDILVAGLAGQGVLGLSGVLAETAARGGYAVAQTGIYGAAVRGGVALGSVIISDTEIDYPYVERADILVALSVASAHAASERWQRDGWLVLNAADVPQWVDTGGGTRFWGVPSALVAEAQQVGAEAVTAVFVGAVLALLPLALQAHCEVAEPLQRFVVAGQRQAHAVVP
ncbi:MAG: 2-oxoacid:acceptor oxidoreductase family protein [Proteobacteria bacterium]|nr:2-oxoacid:acceptor oxidoreductase family protein [Pseudomonadota bacterium]